MVKSLTKNPNNLPKEVRGTQITNLVNYRYKKSTFKMCDHIVNVDGMYAILLFCFKAVNSLAEWEQGS